MGYGFLGEMKSYGCSMDVCFNVWGSCSWVFYVVISGFWLEFLGLGGISGLWLELIFVWVSNK